VVAGLGSTWWPCLLLSLAVAASWAGVPFTGTAAVAASQDELSLAAVIVVAALAGEVGGLDGYAIGPPLGSAAAGTSRRAPGAAGLGCLLVEGERLLGPPRPQLRIYRRSYPAPMTTRAV
jgi:hypothetical protein